MSPEASRYLKQGRIMTAPFDSMCGVEFDIGQLYVIAGRSAHVSICDFVKKYSELSIVEKRGIAGGYKKGCICNINPCFSNNCPSTVGTCTWNFFNECDTNYGVCIPSRGTYDEEGNPSKCHWRRSQPYLSCLNNP